MATELQITFALIPEIFDGPEDLFEKMRISTGEVQAQFAINSELDKR